MGHNALFTYRTREDNVIVADLHLDSPILDATLSDVSDGEVAVDRVYALVDGPIRFQCRMYGESPETFEAALSADDTVASVAPLDTESNPRRYRVSLSPEGRHASLYPVWVDLDGMLLNAHVTDAGWDVRLALPSREALCRFRDRCEERDLSMTLDGLYSRDPMDDDNQFGLTDPQRDILLQAIKLGYFDIPRSASLAELGQSLDITGQAASERLRRALKSLLETSMTDEQSSDIASRSVEG